MIKIRLIVKNQARLFSYDYKEIKKLDLEFQRKLNLLKMYTVEKDFNYQQPEMIYDKKTGDVKIIEKSREKKKKIIQSHDDLQKEKALLTKEVNKLLDKEGPSQELAEKVANISSKFFDDYEIDPNKFQVFSRDGFRVDVGLIIQRPPIFVHLTQRDMEYMTLRSQIMNEYHCNIKNHIEEFEEVVKLNEDILADNPYVSKMNLDNFPTHKLGELTYAAASKNFANVDPKCSDRRSMHYAGEDRTYLILKNKYTQEWEFPTTSIHFGQSFLRAKQNLMLKYSDNKWKVKYFGQLPLIHTVRDFTIAEKESKPNDGLKGVRTYFFGAHHWRGLPEINFENVDHDDWAWIPKRQLNEYFTKQYYDVFIQALKTR